MALLSIIIPFGTSKERPYIKERVIQKARKYKSNEKVEYIFVEGFSSLVCKEIPLIIAECGHEYYKDEKQQKMGAYSLGQCRNLGVMYANSPAVMALDVDCYLSQKNLEKLLEIIQIKGIDKNPNTFLVLPCVFLSEAGTKLFCDETLPNREMFFQNDLISGKREFIKFLMKASSSIAINRFKFLELGGYDRDFQGYGSEDFDFLARLLRNCATFEALPNDLNYFAKNWDFYEFKGFRAWYSLVAEEAMLHGIYLYHLWHIEPNQNGYLDNKELNHRKFSQRLKDYKSIFDGPDTLKENEGKNKNLVTFFSQNSNMYNSLRGIMPYFNQLFHIKEYCFFDEDDIFLPEKFLEYLNKHNITHILFGNSHASEKRLKIFQFAREQNIPFVVYDRGALPDSWFFDSNGFNYDSTSYDEKIWNKTLSEEQKAKTLAYIEEVLKGENFLEEQGARQGSENLKRKLGLRYKKIFFVPLQVEGDSVIKNFTYEPFLYENFLDILNELAQKLLTENIAFVVKKHPLSLNVDKKSYENLVFAPDNTNLNDLLELCDAVLTLNSGVGVYAILAKKPCIVCANAFYHFNNLHLQATNKEELLEHILNVAQGNFNFDEEKALRFIHYLRYEFYSFGKSYYKKSEERGRIYTRVYRIEFYSLVLFGKKLLDFDSVKKQSYKLNSLVYRPFIYEVKERKLKGNSKDNSLIVIPQSKFLHFRFYRLAKKFFTRPKDFIMDSKKPFMKPLKMLINRKI